VAACHRVSVRDGVLPLTEVDDEYAGHADQ
jgi:hypothetical protein